MLRKVGKPISVAVNKVDTPARASLTGEIYSLGFPNVFPVSAEHRQGFDDLLDHVTAGFSNAPAEEPAPDEQTIKVAIIGRPNVGKSTLLNELVGEARSIVSPVAGTTRDAVDETVWRDGVDYVFVDTAGIRRKGKTKLMAEKLSVVMARRHIRMANVVLLVLDATEGVLGLDATIAGYAHEEGRAVILCVNKWDIASEASQKAFTQQIRDELKFLEYAPIAFVSAKTGSGVKRLYRIIHDAYKQASTRITTGELNRFVEQIPFDQDIKIYYMTQSSIRPPTFVVFTDKGRNMHFSTERYIMNQLRKRFGFQGTPIELKTKRR
jgi:GTP-binding protein